MDDVSLPYAKEHLEDLIARAARGEDVQIITPGTKTVRLVASEALAPSAIIFGQWKHLQDIPKDVFLAPLPDEELTWLSGEMSDG
jgi:antitoxin (DNA-binding transcriptional repressor) of toxin-antitoxin stability system